MLQNRQVTAPSYSSMPELPAVEQTITNLDSTKISESKQLHASKRTHKMPEKYNDFVL